MARRLEQERQIELNHAIADANSHGRLGLILYTIPGFPSVRGYIAALDLLNERDSVSIVETTIPVSTGFSEHANETIQRAHLQATNAPQASLMPRPVKPTLCVLYKSTSDTQGFESVLVETAGQFEGLILEWAEVDESPYVAVARKYGLELVQCVGPWMSADTIERIIDRSEEEPLIYLMSAPMTGGQLFSNRELDECARHVKRCRPAAKVAAGFGIRTGRDVGYLAEITNLDAVVVGTAFLDALNSGLKAAERLLEELETALER